LEYRLYGELDLAEGQKGGKHLMKFYLRNLMIAISFSFFPVYKKCFPQEVLPTTIGKYR